MRYQYCSVTDVGIKRANNQDSVLSMEAETEKGLVYLAAVCDGMGGLTHGEVASSMMVEELEKWFQEKFPNIVYDTEEAYSLESRIFAGIKEACITADKRIYKFSRKEEIKCGTTTVVLLLYKGQYYVTNVGDSRTYLYRKYLNQITKDQTVAQEKVDAGIYTEEVALKSPDSAVLLQCIGMNRDIKPEFKTGTCQDGDVFILCSDGFRHKLTDEEIEKAIKEDDPRTKNQLKDMIGYLIDENKKRRETDNISAVCVRVFDDYNS